MEEIARLTDETTIERDEYGRAWIVTTDQYIGLRLLHACYDATTENEEQTVAYDFTVSVVVSYQAPLLTAHREVYAYREGEPWCAPNIVGPEIRVYPGTHPCIRPTKFHINAVMLCGGNADSLRTHLDIVKAEEEKG